MPNRARLVAAAAALIWLAAAGSTAAQGTLRLGVADIRSPHGSDIEIPIEVTGASGVGALHVELSYDPAIVTVREVQQGDLTSGGLVVGNTAMPGQVTISIAQANGFSGDGVIATVLAHVKGNEGEASPLQLANITAHHFQTKAVIFTTSDSGTLTVAPEAAGSLAVWFVVGFMALVLFGALLYAFTRRTTRRNAVPRGTSALGLAAVSGTASPPYLPLDQPLTTIGRSATNRLILDDERVSREHARIISANNIHTIFDLGSTHGLSVNGRQVTQHVLQAGDQITLGSTTLVVR